MSNIIEKINAEHNLTNRYVTTERAMKILGVHIETLFNLEKSNKIDVMRVPNTTKRLYNVEKYINDHKVQSPVNQDHLLSIPRTLSLQNHGNDINIIKNSPVDISISTPFLSSIKQKPIILGVVGPTGPTGIIGVNAVNGLTGPTGPSFFGPTGPVGPVGYTGRTGTTGINGPTGILGQTGPTGISAYNTLIVYGQTSISSNPQVIPNNIITNIVNYNSLAQLKNVSISSGHFTIMLSGIYLVTGTIAYAINSIGTRSIILSITNRSITSSAQHPACSDNYTRISINNIFSLASGDIVQLRGYQTSNTNLNVIEAVLTLCYISSQ